MDAINLVQQGGERGVLLMQVCAADRMKWSSSV